MSDEQTHSPLERLKSELSLVRSKLEGLEQDVSDLISARLAEEETLSSLDLPGLIAAMNRMNRGSTQGEILELLQVEIDRFGERSVLFIRNKNNDYVAYQPVGAAPEDEQPITVSVESDPLKESVRNREILEIDLNDEYVSGWMKQISPSGHGLLVPLIFSDEVPIVAFVCSDREIDADSIQLLAQTGTLILQNHYLHHSLESERDQVARSDRWPVLESASPVDVVVPSVTPAAGVDLATEEVKKEAPLEGETVTEAPASKSEWEAEPHPGGEAVAHGAELDQVSEKDEVEGQPMPEFETADVVDEEFVAEDARIEYDEPSTEPHGADQPAEQEFVPAEEFRPHQESALEESRQAVYEIEKLEQVEAEDLGLSQEEFERLMGRAAEDWKNRELSTDSEALESVEAAADIDEQATAAEQVTEPSGWDSAPDGATEPPPESADKETIPAEDQEEERGVLEAEHIDITPEETLHMEAKRFARLLVAEIKLYNETEVEKGREQRDLYQRLKSDIDRSREMYEKRAHPSIKEKVDYLHSELVRVLAKDDTGVLGVSYPGPRITGEMRV